MEDVIDGRTNGQTVRQSTKGGMHNGRKEEIMGGEEGRKERRKQISEGSNRRTDGRKGYKRQQSTATWFDIQPLQHGGEGTSANNHVVFINILLVRKGEHALVVCFAVPAI